MAKLRVFFIPFYATGHMLPLLDLAFLFAATRPNVDPTFLTTPANAALLQPIIDRYAANSPGRHVITLLLYPFPSHDLLPGQENVSSVPYADVYKICTAGDLSLPAVDALLRLHRPDAVVADVAFWWMPSLARDLGVPNIVFHAIGVFPQLVMDSLHQMQTYVQTEDPSNVADVIEVPGRAGVRIPRSELPRFLRKYTHLTEAWAKMKAAQKESYGVVVNTFYGLEKDYCEEYRKTVCRKAWFVGPVALAGGGGVAGGGGGGRRRVAAGDRESSGSSCLKWLDEKRDRSVIFVCFGSWCNFSNEQLREMALGLEESGKSFIWAVRGSRDGVVTEEKDWMPNGWEERVSCKGLVIRGWCPQVSILGHRAVGGFMTHCGWNSIMEAVSAGVGVLTWPLVFEQFMSERLVVERVGAGVRVWDGFRSTSDEERVVVPGEVIGRAVAGFMEGGGGGARERAGELAVMAKEAVAEGGESWGDLNCLIDELERERERRIRLGSEILSNGSSVV